ncbi:FAM26D [Pelobates cultripes]|uniref:FAM26D n=1 Tax=Pelobates cultripes TaxID=61616 RepID=A0AAD1RFX3_PELCU|nr:FAM26D [Pelobates cultripes]
MSISSLITFLKSKESIIFNGAVALLTVGGQQLFSFFAFSCPCHHTHNLNYGLAFLGVPALILLIVGFVFNDNTWRLFTNSASRFYIHDYSRQSTLIRYKLICYVLLSIIGRALVAPVTWLAVTLLNGSYYVCALSEYVSVEQYDFFRNMSIEVRRNTLAQLPCQQLVPANLSRIREEILLELKYQSQVTGWILIALVAVTVFLVLCIARCCSPLSYLHLWYWTNYINNEQTLFEQATDQHSKIYAMENIKKFFGFAPGSKHITDIRIPSRDDWKAISGLDLLQVINADHCNYSLLHSWTEEDKEDGKYIHLDVAPDSADNVTPP